MSLLLPSNVVTHWCSRLATRCERGRMSSRAPTVRTNPHFKERDEGTQNLSFCWFRSSWYSAWHVNDWYPYFKLVRTFIRIPHEPSLRWTVPPPSTSQGNVCEHSPHPFGFISSSLLARDRSSALKLPISNFEAYVHPALAPRSVHSRPSSPHTATRRRPSLSKTTTRSCFQPIIHT